MKKGKRGMKRTEGHRRNVSERLEAPQAAEAMVTRRLSDRSCALYAKHAYNDLALSLGSSPIGRTRLNLLGSEGRVLLVSIGVWQSLGRPLLVHDRD